jgi:hypothetical protein
LAEGVHNGGYIDPIEEGYGLCTQSQVGPATRRHLLLNCYVLLLKVLWISKLESSLFFVLGLYVNCSKVVSVLVFLGSAFAVIYLYSMHEQANIII